MTVPTDIPGLTEAIHSRCGLRVWKAMPSKDLLAYRNWSAMPRLLNAWREDTGPYVMRDGFLDEAPHVSTGYLTIHSCPNSLSRCVGNEEAPGCGKDIRTVKVKGAGYMELEYAPSPAGTYTFNRQGYLTHDPDHNTKGPWWVTHQCRRPLQTYR